MENFKSKIASILEVENIELLDELESFEYWDSLTILCILAFTAETYKVELTADDIKESKTVGGLLDLIKSRM